MPSYEKTPVFTKRTSGGTNLFLRVIKAGENVILLLTGGDVPHIGAVAVGVPRPSLLNPEVTSADASVFVLTGHKDDELAKPLAKEAASILGKAVVAVVGIHVHAPTEQEIAEIVEAGLELGREAMRVLF